MSKLRKSTIISSIICIVLGLLLLLHPIKSAVFMYIALGGGLILLGVIYCVSYFIKKRKGEGHFFDLVIGIITVVIGIASLTFYNGAVDMIQYIMGVLIVIHGISNISQAFQTKKFGYPRWGGIFVMGLFTILMGAFLLWAPFNQTATINMIAGAFLLFDAISDIYVYIKVAVSKEGRAVNAQEKAERRAAREELKQAAYEEALPYAEPVLVDAEPVLPYADPTLPEAEAVLVDSEADRY